jgi:hypothetical protein
VIHHGGNNFVHRMPVLRQAGADHALCLDGHDNATRVQETGHGLKLDRYGWSDDELAASIMTLLTDAKMKARLRRTSKAMRAEAWADQGSPGNRCADTTPQASFPHLESTMTAPSTLDRTAPHIFHPERYCRAVQGLGRDPTMIEGESRTSGLVLHKGRTARMRPASGSVRLATGIAT